MRLLITLALTTSALVAMPAGAAVAVPTCSGQKATIVGTPGQDYLVGTPGRDVIVAGDGKDQVLARGGNDLVCGGEGNDQLYGGPGRDVLLGEGSRRELNWDWSLELLFGGSGADVLRGGPGSEQLYGQGGRDRLFGGDDNDWAYGGGGRDRALGGDGGDSLSGGGGNDVLRSGLNTIAHSMRFGRTELFSGDPGDDRLIAGPAPSELSFYAAPRGVTVDLAKGIARGLGRDTISGFATVGGSKHADRILGSAGDDNLTGGGGADVVRGRAGLDTVGGNNRARLYGGPGTDSLYPSGKAVAYGGSGNDNLLVYGGSGYGGPGDDELWYQTKDAVLLDGGEGWDLATWLDAPARLVLDLVTGKALVGKSAVSVGGLEDVVGTRFDDVLRGDDNANKLSGVLGNDKLFGRGGDDQIWGGSEYEEATSGDLADGGEGTDQCDAPTTVACE